MHRRKQRTGVFEMLSGNDGEFEMQRGLQSIDFLCNNNNNADNNKILLRRRQHMFHSPPPKKLVSLRVVTPPSRHRMKLDNPNVQQLYRQTGTSSRKQLFDSSCEKQHQQRDCYWNILDDNDDDDEWISIVPYELLRDCKIVPPGVDPTMKEESLSDDEFELLLHMNRMEFRKLAPWKKCILKRKAGLF